MIVIVNTDRHLTASDDLRARVEADVATAIDRFGERVTRVEVHLNDENSGKAGATDKRCMMEARLRGQPPVAVTARADDYELAIATASGKLERALDSVVGRLDDRRAAAEPAGSE
jgi:ribosome-associated translation inhibitor RaiA